MPKFKTGGETQRRTNWFLSEKVASQQIPRFDLAKSNCKSLLFSESCMLALEGPGVPVSSSHKKAAKATELLVAEPL